MMSLRKELMDNCRDVDVDHQKGYEGNEKVESKSGEVWLWIEDIDAYHLFRTAETLTEML